MAAPLYVARASIERLDALHRRASIQLGFRTARSRSSSTWPPRELPLPVDYVVAATGG